MGAITCRAYGSICSKCPMRGVVHLIAKAESIIFCVSCLSETCYAQLRMYMFMWFRFPLLGGGQD